MERGICHARLPIDEFIEMKTRKVLTVDHVFDILAGSSAGKSWKDAFLRVLPARKGAEEKREEEDAKGTKASADDGEISREKGEEEEEVTIDKEFCGQLTNVISPASLI